MKKVEEMTTYTNTGTVANAGIAYNDASLCPMVQPSYSPINTTYPFPYPSGSEFAVPTQQWLPVPLTTTFSDAMGPVYPAKLVFYPYLAP